MIARKLTLLSSVAVFLLLAACSASAQAAAPAWHIKVSSQPTAFPPNTPAQGGFGELPEYLVTATNIGSAPTDGSLYSITDTLPAGIAAADSGLQVVTRTQQETVGASGHALPAGQSISWVIAVDVGNLPEGSTVTNNVTISGGGAPSVSAQTNTPISNEPPPYALLGGSGLRFSDENGTAITQAGSRPYEMTVDLSFPTVQNPNWTILGGSRVAFATFTSASPAARPSIRRQRPCDAPRSSF